MVGRLDIGLAVDAQFGNQQTQQRLDLLGLTVGDQRFELAGDRCEVRNRGRPGVRDNGPASESGCVNS
jgi:hypothetical protein